MLCELLCSFRIPPLRSVSPDGGVHCPSNNLSPFDGVIKVFAEISAYNTQVLSLQCCNGATVLGFSGVPIENVDGRSSPTWPAAIANQYVLYIILRHFIRALNEMIRQRFKMFKKYEIH